MSGFGIENLPYGVFGFEDRVSIGVAFGDAILDLRLYQSRVFMSVQSLGDSGWE